MSEMHSAEKDATRRVSNPLLRKVPAPGRERQSSTCDHDWTAYSDDVGHQFCGRDGCGIERVIPPATSDRGCTLLLPLLGLAFVALGGYGAVAGWFVPWQVIGFGVLAAFVFACVACCHNDGTRERLDELAPKAGAR